jgi:hypothetical protein
MGTGALRGWVFKMRSHATCWVGLCVSSMQTMHQYEATWHASCCTKTQLFGISLCVLTAAWIRVDVVGLCACVVCCCCRQGEAGTEPKEEGHPGILSSHPSGCCCSSVVLLLGTRVSIGVAKAVLAGFARPGDMCAAACLLRVVHLHLT